MSGRVILLNGPAGVGKTTVGRALASLVPNGSCIHGDCLKSFIVSRVDGVVAGGLGYVNGAVIASTFIEAGYDLVVFEYVFERPSNVDRFLASFHLPVPVHLFTLWAPLRLVMEREQARPDHDRLGQRVVSCYRSIERHLDQLGQRIDTGDRPVADVAAHIHHLCQEDAGLVELHHASSSRRARGLA